MVASANKLIEEKRWQDQILYIWIHRFAYNYALYNKEILHWSIGLSRITRYKIIGALQWCTCKWLSATAFEYVTQWISFEFWTLFYRNIFIIIRVVMKRVDTIVITRTEAHGGSKKEKISPCASIESSIFLLIYTHSTQIFALLCPG